MNCKKEQIQERREFGKEYLYRRGRADSVIRLGSNLFAGEAFSACVSPSHVPYFIGTSELKRLCFYKKSSGYFLFFPASGNRHYSNGTLNNSGTNGYGWTSTPYDSANAWYLDSWSTNARTNANNRGNGLPVRCVQASAPVFVFIKDTFCFFPASGFRQHNTGGLSSVGSEGDGWSSVPGGNGAFRMIFTSGYAYVTSVGLTHGFSVRCVQASAPVFAFTNDTLCFFPASGYRNFTDGKLAGSGANASGYGWTSTLNGNNAWSVVVWTGGARMDSYSRSDGFSVRCVQASAAVFAFANDTFVFFPASGYHLNNDGGLRNSGTYGYGWTSTPGGGGGSNLYFSAGGTYMSHYDRDSGRSVRCVQASATVFVLAHDTFLFFPASGFRSFDDGNLRYPDVRGYGWTSISAGNEACFFRALFGLVQITSYDRGDGFPVRCVQASASVWVLQKENIKQIRFRRESGKVRLCRRGQADSVTRLGCKLSASENYFVCAAPSYSIPLIKLPVFKCLYFYKHSSGYFLFFPASGVRSFDAGILYNGGVEGDAWTSSPAVEGRAWYLYFMSGSLWVSQVSRCYGFPVRCVQASAAVFVYARKGIGRFPATGYRNYDDGTLRVSGASGYGWTSASDGSGRGGYLDFWPTIARMYSNSCTYGFAVRCVQASATVFAFTKDTFCFFPAAGIRNNSDGSLLNSGVEGDGWTSVPDGNNAFRLIFKSGYAYVTSVNRTYGFPVRCVQASAAVFAFEKDVNKRINIDERVL